MLKYRNRASFKAHQKVTKRMKLDQNSNYDQEKIHQKKKKLKGKTMKSKKPTNLKMKILQGLSEKD